MKLIFTIILLAFGLQINAQNMKDIISNMPDSITPLLTKNNKLDFIDYIEAGQKAEEKNKLKGMSTMEKLTETRALLQISKSSSMDFKLIRKTTPQIGVITTVKSDSTYTSIVKYYDLKWNLIKTIIPHDFTKMEWNDDNEEISETKFDPMKLKQDEFKK